MGERGNHLAQTMKHSFLLLRLYVHYSIGSHNNAPSYFVLVCPCFGQYRDRYYEGAQIQLGEAGPGIISSQRPFPCTLTLEI